ncbi:hypothetical protein CANCADRAFT_29549 [Tortispora caseinolytica NRRL Y-17796]|uniref:Aspartyl aminopeptidase n=1 Tax=Tortispora caseinolytica NRRL Y-17796 TaxID=767744 RepID=A0A1E4T9R6_9ASCO|nr:hypothetical protein CANCADRAFT_29549 [Tortispora caseinolytica NRRL Y-17796]
MSSSQVLQDSLRSLIEENRRLVDKLTLLEPPTSKESPPARTTKAPEKSYSEQYVDWTPQCPTVYHAVSSLAERLLAAGFVQLSERDRWDSLGAGTKAFVVRNGSCLIAFVVGGDIKEKDPGFGMVGCHVDAITVRLKPLSKKNSDGGYTMLAVAPYAGGLNPTWWDRDLGLGGRVLVKSADGSIATKLIHFDHPVARIPTLAPHFGAPANGPFNMETQMTPIIALEPTDPADNEPTPEEAKSHLANRHNIHLLRAIAKNLDVEVADLLDFDLELFDTQPAAFGGLKKDFLFAPRIDDKICSFASLNALIDSADEYAHSGDAVIMCGLFDNEEIGSLTRQGARGGLLENSIRRISEFNGWNVDTSLAKSFLISADVSHAYNPNFPNVYLENHRPQLNVGPVVSCDASGHMATDAVSTVFAEAIAKKCDSTLQYFQIRNDSRSGGTIGPMLSASMGCRTIDIGIGQLSMHSIRATTGSKDVDLFWKFICGFYMNWKEVDSKFV